VQGSDSAQEANHGIGLDEAKLSSSRAKPRTKKIQPRVPDLFVHPSDRASPLATLIVRQSPAAPPSDKLATMRKALEDPAHPLVKAGQAAKEVVEDVRINMDFAQGRRPGSLRRGSIPLFSLS
jgi:hypothetical protein